MATLPFPEDTDGGRTTSRSGWTLRWAEYARPKSDRLWGEVWMFRMFGMLWHVEHCADYFNRFRIAAWRSSRHASNTFSTC